MVVNILIVDDEPDWRELMYEHLLGSNLFVASIHQAASSDAALEYASRKDNEIDICIIDQKLDAQMGGITLIKHLRVLRPKANFILISGISKREHVRDAYESGISRILSKSKDDNFEEIEEAVFGLINWRSEKQKQDERHGKRLKRLQEGMRGVTSDEPIEETMEGIGNALYEGLSGVGTITIWHKHHDQNPRKAQCAYHKGLRNPEVCRKPTQAVVDTMQRKKRRYTLDTSQLSERQWRRNPFLECEKIRTTIEVPLRSDEYCHGALMIGFREEVLISPNELAIIDIFGLILAANIRDSNQIRILNQVKAVNEAVSDTLEQSEAISRIIEILLQRFPNSRIAIYSVAPDSGMLTLLPESFDSYDPDRITEEEILVLDPNKPEAGLVSKALREARKSIDKIGVINAANVAKEESYISSIPGVEVALAVASASEPVSTSLIIESEIPILYSTTEKDFAVSVARIISAVLTRSAEKRESAFKSLVASRVAWATELTHDGINAIGKISNRIGWTRKKFDEIESHPEDVRVWLDEVEDQITRLSEIVKNPAQGGPVQTFDLTGFLRDSAEEIIARRSYKMKVSVVPDFKFSDEIIETTQPKITLRRILRYLLNNAVEAIASEPKSENKITISADLLEEDPSIKISVKDNGPGIPVEHRARLFYEQISDDEGEEHGFGLLFARMLTEELGGRMWLDPSSNEFGTRIVFTIPLTFDKEGRK